MKSSIIVTAAFAIWAVSIPGMTGEGEAADAKTAQITADITAQGVEQGVQQQAVLQARNQSLHQALAARLQQGDIDRGALPKLSQRDLQLGYQSEHDEDVTAPRTVTILADKVSVEDIAYEFGLTVVYQDQSTGIGVLDIEGHDDIMVLVEQLRASGLVRAARPSRTERGFELDIAR